MDDAPHQSSPGADAMTGTASRQDWESLPPNPDLHDDLGYEVFDLESYETDEEHVLLIPADEDMLRDEAFMVVAAADMVTLEE